MEAMPSFSFTHVHCSAGVMFLPAKASNFPARSSPCSIDSDTRWSLILKRFNDLEQQLSSLSSQCITFHKNWESGLTKAVKDVAQRAMPAEPTSAPEPVPKAEMPMVPVASGRSQLRTLTLPASTSSTPNSLLTALKRSESTDSSSLLPSNAAPATISRHASPRPSITSMCSGTAAALASLEDRKTKFERRKNARKLSLKEKKYQKYSSGFGLFDGEKHADEEPVLSEEESHDVGEDDRLSAQQSTPPARHSLAKLSNRSNSITNQAAIDARLDSPPAQHNTVTHSILSNNISISAAAAAAAAAGAADQSDAARSSLLSEILPPNVCPQDEQQPQISLDILSVEFGDVGNVSQEPQPMRRQTSDEQSSGPESPTASSGDNDKGSACRSPEDDQSAQTDQCQRASAGPPDMDALLAALLSAATPDTTQPCQTAVSSRTVAFNIPKLGEADNIDVDSDADVVATDSAGYSDDVAGSDTDVADTQKVPVGRPCKASISGVHEKQMADIAFKGAMKLGVNSSLMNSMEELHGRLSPLHVWLKTTGVVSFCHLGPQCIFGDEDDTATHWQRCADGMYCYSVRAGMSVLALKEVLILGLIYSNRESIATQSRQSSGATWGDVPSSMVTTIIRIVVYMIAPFLHVWLRRFLGQDPFLFDLLKYSLLRCGSSDGWITFMHFLVLFGTAVCTVIFLCIITARDPMEHHIYAELDNPQGMAEWRVVESFLLALVWLFWLQFLCLLSGIFSALRLSLDAYGRAIGDANCDSAKIRDLSNAWRSLNALVRSVGFATQVPVTLLIVASSSMLMLCNTSLVMFDDQALFLGGASCFFTVLIVFILSNAASVTTRCARIPTLVNGLVTSDELGKMLLVQYIRNSDSGYRLWNEPVTLFFVVKVGYVLIAASLFVFQNVVS